MQAYGGLMNRLVLITEHIRKATYGLEPLTTELIEFQQMDIRFGSKLI